MTAAQEVAFRRAAAFAYVEAAVARWLDVDAFAGRLSFFSAAWSKLFEEVAKCRVARRMWATIMKERFGAKDPRSMVCRFHVQTAGSSLTAQSVDNNVVRTTVQALAAVLGGAQSLHTNSRDEALALPTEEAARLALRTQQILAYESGVTETPDPLAGSYYLESLTNELEAAAWTYLDEIESMGGTLAAIEGGFQQRQIQEAAYRVQRAIETGEQIVVGVTRYRDDEMTTQPLHTIDPDGEPRQVAGVARARPGRAGEPWRGVRAGGVGAWAAERPQSGVSWALGLHAGAAAGHRDGGDRRVAGADHPDRGGLGLGRHVTGGDQQHPDDADGLLGIVAAVAQAVRARRHQLQAPEPAVDPRRGRAAEHPGDQHHHQRTEQEAQQRRHEDEEHRLPDARGDQ